MFRDEVGREVAAALRALVGAGGLRLFLAPGALGATLRPLLRNTPPLGVVHLLQARIDADRTGLVDLQAPEGRRQWWSYGELDELVDSFALGLLRRGIGPGERVIVMTGNRPEFIGATYGALRIGATPVPTSASSRAAELERLAAASKATLCVHAGRSDSVGAALSQWDVESESPPAAGRRPVLAPRRPARRAPHGLLFTSGTTGAPKGLALDTRLGLVFQFAQLVAHLGLDRLDRIYVPTPLYHAAGNALMHASFGLGATLMIGRRFDPLEALDVLQTEGVTVCFMVPTMLARILDLPQARLDRFSSSSLRVLLIGGAALQPSLARRAQPLFGRVLYSFYGATEVGIVTLATPEDIAARPETAGRILPGNEILIRDDRGRSLPPGAVGELYIRNAALARRVDGAAPAEGFVHCGDLASVDGEGYLTIHGRADDVIVSGGVNLYPDEIESLLCEHPAVVQAAVVGVADDEWGACAWAFVVRRGELKEDQLRSWAKERIAPAKVPKRVVFRDELPLGRTGKVLRRALRDQAAALATAVEGGRQLGAQQ